MFAAGDCSLMIVSVDVTIDEGEWQCGVTSSNVTLQDSLVSSAVWLAVMGELSRTVSWRELRVMLQFPPPR